MIKNQQRIIIGCGTGRCGTVSLAKLLDGEHEPKPILPWTFSSRLYAKQKAQLVRGGVFVGFYYLNYLEQILEDFEDVRVVVLHRSISETIESFIRKTGGKNHWRDNINEWSEAFPDIDLPIWKAIGEYHINYYLKVFELEKKFPDKIEVFNMDKLNSEEGQKEIMNFCGVERPTVKNCRFNITNFYEK